MTTDRRSFLTSVGAGLVWSGCVANAQTAAQVASPKPHVHAFDDERDIDRLVAALRREL